MSEATFLPAATKGDDARAMIRHYAARQARHDATLRAFLLIASGAFLAAAAMAASRIPHRRFRPDPHGDAAAPVPRPDEQMATA